MSQAGMLKHLRLLLGDSRGFGIGLKLHCNTDTQMSLPAGTYCWHTDSMQGEQQKPSCQTGQQPGKLTLDEVVRIIDNVSTEEDGAQQGEDGVLNWAWW